MNNVAPTVKAGADQIIYEGDTAILNPATFNDKGTLDTPIATIRGLIFKRWVLPAVSMNRMIGACYSR